MTTMVSSAIETVMHWSGVLWTILTSSVCSKDLVGLAIWHHAVSSILGWNCVLRTCLTDTIISLEFMLRTLNVDTFSEISSWFHVWWALLTLAINFQDFIWLTDNLNAVETSAFSIIWTSLALSTWKQLFSETAFHSVAFPWIFSEPSVVLWAVLASTIW